MTEAPDEDALDPGALTDEQIDELEQQGDTPTVRALAKQVRIFRGLARGADARIERLALADGAKAAQLATMRKLAANWRAQADRPAVSDSVRELYRRCAADVDLIAGDGE